MKMIKNEEFFLITKEYKRFKEFCEACIRDKYIGLCYGPAGVGKTLSARYYSSWDVVESYYKSRNMYEIPDISKSIPEELQNIHTVFFTPEVVNSPASMHKSLIYHYEITQRIQTDIKFIELLNKEIYTKKNYDKMRTTNWLKTFKYSYNNIDLLIVDETDRLKLTTLEALRDHYDKTSSGMILIGMPGIERKLSRYAQLYSRIGFALEFRALSNNEMAFIMTRHLQKINIDFSSEDFTDNETINTIIQITRGNLRLLNRLFRQIERIMKINNIKTITKEIVLAARECLVIGI